jgi:hypothetical protein
MPTKRCEVCPRRESDGMSTEGEAERPMAAEWARLLLERDSVHGRATLERMVQWHEEHDHRAWDFGELWIVEDARRALAEQPMS